MSTLGTKEHRIARDLVEDLDRFAPADAVHDPAMAQWTVEKIYKHDHSLTFLCSRWPRHTRHKQVVVAKHYLGDDDVRQRGEREFRVLEWLHRNGALTGSSFFTPQPLFWIPERAVLLMQHAPGQLLRDHILEKNLYFQAAHPLFDLSYNIGCGLNLLHQITPDFLEGIKQSHLHDLIDETRSLIDALRRGFVFTSSWARSMDRTVITAWRLLDGFDLPKTFIHGDFHGNNMLLDSEKLYLLDFESSRIDFPQLDLARFLTYTDNIFPPYRGLLRYRKQSLPRLHMSFLQGYGHLHRAQRPGHEALLSLCKLKYYLFDLTCRIQKPLPAGVLRKLYEIRVRRVRMQKIIHRQFQDLQDKLSVLRNL